MDDKILFIYCLCDDFLKALRHYEDPQCKMKDAEVMTTALVAMLFFGGNFEHARAMLADPRYIPGMLSKSRFSRRLHCIHELFFNFHGMLAHTWKRLNAESVYLIDSFPVSVCDNYRIPRAKIYSGEEYRGYIASKRRYFYGLKIHVLATGDGRPVEFFLTPGSFGDVDALKIFDFDLPEGSIVYGDKAYNEYVTEDILREAAAIQLLPLRKKNSNRALPPYVEYIQHRCRKFIETVGSLIERMLPKSIHAVTSRGFELKVSLFVIAYALNLS